MNLIEEMKEIGVRMAYYIYKTLGLTNYQQEIINPPSDLEKTYQLFEIAIFWDNKDIGRIGRYLHDPVGDHKESLFDLLKKKEWDVDLIKSILDEIAVIKTAKKDSSGTPDYSRLGSIDFL